MQLEDERPSLLAEICGRVDDLLFPWCDTLLKSGKFENLMALITIYALFGEDLKLAYANYADETFEVLTSTSFFLFLFEFCLQFYVKPEYRFGFYFYLDIVSTVSLVTDMPWMLDLFGLDGTGGEFRGAQASRTSRAGAKASRVVRIVRLVRMVRIVKLFKWKNSRDERKEEQDEEEDIAAQPSKVSKKLTELTVQHIIVIILLMIFFFPFLDQPKQLTASNDLDPEQFNGMEILHKLAIDWNSTGKVSMDEFRLNLQEYAKAASKHLLLIHIEGVDDSVLLDYLKPEHVDCDYLEDSNFWKSARQETEVGTYASLDANVGCIQWCKTGQDYSCAFFDISDNTQREAWLSFIKTCFVILVLSCAVYVFSQDALTLVVEPIERMMTLVQKLAENPLGDLKRKADTCGGEHDGQADETVLLEQTLSKISGLLQVGFGMAGSEVIGKSMSIENDGEFNYMLAGKKITSVFGFAIIEEFTNTCSCLEEETCTYINTIAEIVHKGAHSFHGAPNKNIGCAFLMVWKICDGVLPGMRDLRDTEPKPVTPEFREWRDRQRKSISWPSKGLGTEIRQIPPQEMVESAVTSFLKVEVDMHHANHGGKLSYFNENAAMIEEFGTNFLVNMGLGLHIGWAIEGTIGSRYKIDASYLSPNVNVAARLEAATHIFGCPLLLSGFLVDELSPAARMMHRKVDVVSVKGSAVPLEIWTFDIVNFPEHVLEPKLDDQGIQQPVDFEWDEDYRHLQKGLEPLFVQSFNAAVVAYIDGNWTDARTSLEKALSINPKDGPSKSLMSVLASKKFVAPGDWNGYRALTSKT